VTENEREWLKANAPGGWIDNMRQALRRIAAYDVPDAHAMIVIARAALDAKVD
jgi:hypothetical protein